MFGPPSDCFLLNQQPFDLQNTIPQSPQIPCFEMLSFSNDNETLGALETSAVYPYCPDDEVREYARPFVQSIIL